MKATISLDGILSVIHAFSLNADNKRWLGEKLLEEARKEETAAVSASKFYGVWKDEDFPELNADELATEIKSGRNFKKNAMEF